MDNSFLTQVRQPAAVPQYQAHSRIISYSENATAFNTASNYSKTEANLNHNMFNNGANYTCSPISNTTGVCNPDTGKRFLSKLFLPLTIFLIMIATTNGIANAQDIEQDSIIMKIGATDAIGNSDTIGISAKKDIPPLEQINLYGTPPQGDLDLRIVTRTDTNGYHHKGGNPSGLVGENKPDDIHFYDGEQFGGRRPSNHNADLKKMYTEDSITDFFPLWTSLPLSLYAINYPVTLGYQAIRGDGFLVGFMNAELTFHNSSDGKVLDVPVTFIPYLQDNSDYSFSSQWHPYSRNGYTNYFRFTRGLNAWIDTISYESFLIILNKNNNNRILLLWLTYQNHHVIDTSNIKTLYPNPASEMVLLEDCNYGEEFIILNSNGNLIYNGSINDKNCFIDISGLITGTYFIKTNTYFYKLIKQEN